ATEQDLKSILGEDNYDFPYKNLAQNINPEYREAYMDYLRYEQDPARNIDIDKTRQLVDSTHRPVLSLEQYAEEFINRTALTREYLGEAYREGNMEAIEKLKPEFESNRKLYEEYHWENNKDMDFRDDYRELQAEYAQGWMSEGEYDSSTDRISEVEKRHDEKLEDLHERMMDVVSDQDQVIKRDIEINTPGIYVYRQPYNDGVPEPFWNIRDLDDLKHEVKAVLEDERKDNYHSWHPEEYTDKNIREFHAQYDKEIDKVMNGSMAEVLNTMERYNVTLTQVHPAKLSGEDFAMERNPAFIQREELKLNGQNLEFTRVELPRNVERQIQVSLGTVQGVKEREQDRGHFAVVKDRFGDNYSMVRVDKTPEGHQLNVKRGFPTLDAAENQMENQLGRESLKPNKEMEKTPSMELSR
ncbi:hypothetical protein V7159_20960, partial [Priestia megaterium]